MDFYLYKSSLKFIFLVNAVAIVVEDGADVVCLANICLHSYICMCVCCWSLSFVF